MANTEFTNTGRTDPSRAIVISPIDPEEFAELRKKYGYDGGEEQAPQSLPEPPASPFAP